VRSVGDAKGDFRVAAGQRSPLALGHSFPVTVEMKPFDPATNTATVQQLSANS
jgi:hypothetical protein